MCNHPTDFLQTCRGSTNIAIHRRLAKIIDNRFTWLEYDFFNMLAKFFIFGMPTHFLAKGFVWLEMLLTQCALYCPGPNVICYNMFFDFS